jgi:putative intracellular protease/amidase
MKILMVVTDGFEDIEAVGTLAILRRAQLDVTFAAIDNTHALGRYGVNITDLVNLKDVNIDEYDMLIIPGGPEYIAEERNPEFLKISQQSRAGTMKGTVSVTLKGRVAETVLPAIKMYFEIFYRK